MADYGCSTMALPPLHMQVVLLGNLTSPSADDTYEYAVSKRWTHIWNSASDEDGKSLPSVYMDMKDGSIEDDTSGNVYIAESKFTTLISWHGLEADHQLRRRQIQCGYVPLEHNATFMSVFMNRTTDFLRLNVRLLDNLENEKLDKTLDFFAWDNIEHLDRQVRRVLNVPRNVSVRLWLLVEKGAKKLESFAIKAGSDKAMGSFLVFLCSILPEMKTVLSQRKYGTSMPHGTSDADSSVRHIPVYRSCSSLTTGYSRPPITSPGISIEPMLVYPSHTGMSIPDSTPNTSPMNSMLYEDVALVPMKLNIAVERMSIGKLDHLCVVQNSRPDTALDQALQSIDTLTLIRSDWEDALHNVLEDCSGRVEVKLEQTKADLMQAACGIIRPKVTELDSIKSQYEERLATIHEREKQVANTEAEVVEKQTRLNNNFEKFTMDLNFLKCQREELSQQIESMEKQNQICETKVFLDVGGCRYTTSTLTLTKYPDSMLGVMFSGRHRLTRESDGSIFIDRDGSNFGHMLNFLRDGDSMTTSLPTDHQSLYSIKREAEYYQITELVNIVEMKLQN